MLAGMISLTDLDFRNNPVTSTHKYRDHIILMCKRLVELDGKDVKPT